MTIVVSLFIFHIQFVPKGPINNTSNIQVKSFGAKLVTGNYLNQGVQPSSLTKFSDFPLTISCCQL